MADRVYFVQMAKEVACAQRCSSSRCNYNNRIVFRKMGFLRREWFVAGCLGEICWLLWLMRSVASKLTMRKGGFVALVAKPAQGAQSRQSNARDHSVDGSVDRTLSRRGRFMIECCCDTARWLRTSAGSREVLILVLVLLAWEVLRSPLCRMHLGPCWRQASLLLRS